MSSANWPLIRAATSTENKMSRDQRSSRKHLTDKTKSMKLHFSARFIFSRHHLTAAEVGGGHGFNSRGFNIGIKSSSIISSSLEIVIYPMSSGHNSDLSDIQVCTFVSKYVGREET